MGSLECRGDEWNLKMNNYFDTEEKKVKPKKLLKHCIVCNKKKGLLFYCSTKDFILQICNKCWDERGGEDEN